MRQVNVLIISILTLQLSYSQINEIGVFAGGSNFIGDVGATNFIAPNQLAFGGIYKWNRSARHSYRISMIFTELEGLDINSDDPRRQFRNYGFNNSILEISAGMEFTFLPFNLHEGTPVATPYLYSGISVARNEGFLFFDGNQIAQSEKEWSFGIPMVLGFKTRFIDNFILGLEVGARYTFSDNFDASNPENNPFNIGNINNNDWYVFSGVTLTYTFGENPCYCVD